MKKKKIYAKENFKIGEYSIYIYDKALNNLYLVLINNGFVELANNTNIILTSNNKLDISKAINNIVDYYPKTEFESELKEKIIFCILKNKKLNVINIEKILLNLEYQIDLNTAVHEFDDDVVFSDKINSIPYINSIRQNK